MAGHLYRARNCFHRISGQFRGISIPFRRKTTYLRRMTGYAYRACNHLRRVTGQFRCMTGYLAAELTTCAV